MLGAHGRQTQIGVEMRTGDIGQPQRHIGKFGEAQVGIGHEAGRIDDHLADVEFPPQQSPNTSIDGDTGCIGDATVIRSELRNTPSR